LRSGFERQVVFEKLRDRGTIFFVLNNGYLLWLIPNHVLRSGSDIRTLDRVLRAVNEDESV
jgi:hypothetical protein